MKPTIGLEIHAELKTRSKLFCACPNDPDEHQPNLNICPICLGHPGTLPVLNKEAVKQVLQVGLAVGGRLADFSEFDRKHYFYPDIPKGYQISQYQYPLVAGGEFRDVKLTRIHLEEDTARSQHEGESSLIDFNRSGVPLMELVTEPVITSAKEAGDFARELQLLLRYLDVAEANMEKGEMRVEANISVTPPPPDALLAHGHNGEFADKASGGSGLGTKVEVKNLNSFRSVERAIEYEVKRQGEVLARGEKIIQETRGWDEVKGITFSQRQKESSHDYRYFPEPDLPKLRLSEVAEWRDLAATIPELPWQRRERFLKLGIKAEDVEVLVTNPKTGDFFDAQMKKMTTRESSVVILSNYLTNDVINLIESDLSLLSKFGNLNEVVDMVVAGELSSRGAKDVLTELKNSGGHPRAIVEKRGLFQKSSEGDLAKIVGEVVAANPKVAADYRAGKQAALQFLVGQGMKASRGAANPEVLKKLFEKRLT